ncbi:MAG: LysM peptidoglycan-binding domain-containing protein [Clostridia bacterium]|nr:LysM peptidoglycan-binding domain-containing protein [Clostridia bacterium]
MSQNQNGSICAEEYVVKRGDSFYLIAHKLGVPLRDLLAANRDIHPARLMVGDVLCIPREEDDRPQGSGNTGGGGAAGGSSNSGDNHIGGGRPGESNGNGSNGASGSNSNTSGSGASGGNSSNGSAANNSSNGAANSNSSLTGGATGNGSSSGSGNTGNSTSSNSNGTGSVTPAPSPAPGLSCPIEEQVTLREGETVADIQLQNLLSRNTLQTANPSVDLDALRAGQTICVPPENIACTLPSTYTLAAGETLEAVAMRFNLPLGSLLRVNPCLAPQDFEEGVTVILPR